MRALRLLILLLFVPTALMPVRLEVCLDCLLGETSCCERAEEACRCCGGEKAAERPAAPSCCSGPATGAPERSEIEVERTRPAPRDCCLRIDNDRDELPASSQAFELPSPLRRFDLAAIQPRALRPAVYRPIVAPEAEPPPASPLPLLI